LPVAAGRYGSEAAHPTLEFCPRPARRPRRCFRKHESTKAAKHERTLANRRGAPEICGAAHSVTALCRQRRSLSGLAPGPPSPSSSGRGAWRGDTILRKYGSSCSTKAPKHERKLAVRGTIKSSPLRLGTVSGAPAPALGGAPEISGGGNTRRSSNSPTTARHSCRLAPSPPSPRRRVAPLGRGA
jgi:hypothetical protein